MAALSAWPLQAFRAVGVTTSRSRTTLRVVARKSAAKTSAAYICIDCGYIYAGKEAFDKLPNSYRCPVCNAPKRRFRPTEAKSRNNDEKAMRSRMGTMARGEDDGKFDEGDKSFFVTAAVGGAVLLGALYLFLNSQTQL
eukprot:GHRQ01002861.1.p1 GENE.GHRQ01002861.1~~GHRQ01002861.1.p1  ORF type:complete len:139 (+),score=27.73 GHRQ01002861.1:376-792(+)